MKGIETTLVALYTTTARVSLPGHGSPMQLSRGLRSQLDELNAAIRNELGRLEKIRQGQVMAVRNFENSRELGIREALKRTRLFRKWRR